MSEETVGNSGDAEFTFGNLLVEWTDIGEGNCGDYNPDDPNDVRRLRFYVRELVDGEWQDIDDHSFCTLMTDTTPVHLLELFARNIAYAARSSSPDRLLQRLTWTTEDELRGVYQKQRS